MPEEGRERWSTRTAFVMAAIGSAVGLGNVWRFPSVVYSHGGGAFFIPYLVALLTAGIPLMILEFGIGQMMQGSAPKSLRKCNRHAEWVGWFALLTGTIISIYYAVVMAWSVEYLVYSIKGIFAGGAMPWSDPNIVSAAEAAKGTTAEGYFFKYTIRNHSLAAGEMWTTVWPVALGLIAVWGAVFLIIYRGVRRVGRVVMWTVPLPVIVLGVLIVRGLTLPGSAEGIRYYLTPSFEALRDPKTWLAAYGQVFFSLTIGFGVLIAYASYRPRNADITNSAFITSFANCATSFFAGFAVFSVLGYLAHAKGGVPVNEVLAGGPGLVFVTYPTAISLMGELGVFWPPVMAILFFVMLLTLGIDSLFSLVEGAVTGLKDRFPWLSRGLLTGAFCFVSLIAGVFVFGNRAGLHWLDIIDHWANDSGLVVVGLLQCVVIGYFFKTDELRDRINAVSEIKLWGWWELCIRFITPIILVYLLASNLLEALTGELYGATGGDFDRYLWVAPAAFGLCFIVAFLISRRRHNLSLVGFGALIFLVAWLGLRRPEPFSVKIKQIAGESAEHAILEAAVEGGREPYTYRWNLGDGTTAAGSNVSHDYSDTENRIVALTVTDARKRSVERTITVDPNPMEVSGSAHVGGLLERPDPLMVVFKGAAEHGKPDYTYVWDFGDKSDTAREADTRHIYAKPGKYVATLTVTDELGRTASDKVSVRVRDKCVHIKARPLHGAAPSRVAFESVLTEVLVGKVKGIAPAPPEEAKSWSYEWLFGDGATSEKADPVHVFAAPGTYRVTLTVRPPTVSAVAPDTIMWVSSGSRWDPPFVPDDTVATDTVPRAVTALPPGTRVLDLDLRDTEARTVDVMPSTGTSLPSTGARSVEGHEPGASDLHDEITIIVAEPEEPTVAGPVLCAVAGAILLGGLFWCLVIARRRGTGQPDETVHGLPPEDAANEE